MVSETATAVIKPWRLCAQKRAAWEPPRGLPPICCQRTTQRLHLGCHRNPAPQTTGATTTGAGATTTGAGATTTGPPLGRHAPYGVRCQPGPQPPSALALPSDMSESKIAAGAADNNFGRIS